jgi:hypothetical protein
MTAMLCKDVIVNDVGEVQGEDVEHEGHHSKFIYMGEESDGVGMM